MPPPTSIPASPYASLYASPSGPGDSRPTAHQIIQDNDLTGKLSDKVVLLTGGSNGIGVEQVRNLARTGARVLFTSRDLSKGERVRDELLKQLKEEGTVGARIEVVKMDLESFDSVKEAAEDVKARCKRLDILILNAGIGNTPHRLLHNLESQFVVDHLSHFLLFHCLLPLLLSSSTTTAHSRVISLASNAHTFNDGIYRDYNFSKRPYTPFAAYAQAKTCNIWFANEVERRYGQHGVHGISVHPGGIQTGFQASHDPEFLAWVMKVLDTPEIRSIMMSVEQGAATPVLAAVGKDFEGKGGFYMENCGIAGPMEGEAMKGAPGYKPWAYDEENERLLWKDSLALLGLKEE